MSTNDPSTTTTTSTTSTTVEIINKKEEEEKKEQIQNDPKITPKTMSSITSSVVKPRHSSNKMERSVDEKAKAVKRSTLRQSRNSKRREREKEEDDEDDDDDFEDEKMDPKNQKNIIHPKNQDQKSSVTKKGDDDNHNMKAKKASLRASRNSRRDRSDDYDHEVGGDPSPGAVHIGRNSASSAMSRMETDEDDFHHGNGGGGGGGGGEFSNSVPILEAEIAPDVESVVAEAIRKERETLQKERDAVVHGSIVIATIDENHIDGQGYHLQEKQLWKRWYVMAAILVVVAVVVIVVAVVVTTNQKTSSPAYVIPTGTFENILASLMTQDNSAVIPLNHTTPAYKALRWIQTTHDLPIIGDTNEHNTILEEAVLAVLYYATSGTEWHNATNWLQADRSFCQGWYGITCTQNWTSMDGAVTTIDLGTLLIVHGLHTVSWGKRSSNNHLLYNPSLSSFFKHKIG